MDLKLEVSFSKSAADILNDLALSLRELTTEAKEGHKAAISVVEQLLMPSTKAPAEKKSKAVEAAEKKAAEAKAKEEAAQEPAQELEESGLEDLFEAPQTPAGITLEALQARCKEMLDTSDNKAEFRKFFVRTLEKHGVKVLSELPAAGYVEFLEQLNEAAG